jgi:O-6-methylguanine DNA methyltransferase
MFKTRVLEIVKNIPKGKTLSYKDVAKMAGSINAYRRVGSIMKENYDDLVPCHRVIKSDGTVGEYNRGRKLKYRKLKEEGAI